MLKGVLQYQVRRKIGEGGMGVVYEGWDERLGRAVAIKTFHEVAASTEARDRLWREARSLARVAHPRVCQIFDVLEEGSDLFLVLELLDGVSLANRLAGGPLPTAEAANIEQQILEALEALHALGITHRDLKPSNIFLTPHGVKLLDFGLARSVMPTAGGPASDSTALTAPEMVVGTPQYMAPEQAKGRGAGPAADIFAAGCILYEMLSGKRPFDGDSRIDILYAVLHHEPPPLSGPREIEAIDVLVRQAINKRPEERYPSARSMLDALGAVGATGAKVTARTVTRLIALPFRLLKKDEETDFLAYSLPEAITSSLSGIDDLIVRSGLLAARFEGALDPKQIGAEAGVDAILSGSLMRAGDQIRLVCQLIEAPSGTVKWSETITSSVRDLFRIQDELAQRIVQSLVLPLSERKGHIFRRDVPASARTYEYYLRANQLASVRTLDNMKLAQELYLQCVRDDPGYAPAWAHLGRVSRFIEKFKGSADRDLTASEDAFRKAFALNPDLAIAHNLYTPIECDGGRADQALLRLLKRAAFRRNDPDLFAGLVQACRYCDQLDASVAAHSRAQHLDPHVVTSVAHTYFMMGEYQKALDCYGTKVGYYLDCLALVALGERDTALARLRERERADKVAFRPMVQSLRAYLEEDFEGSFRAIEAGEAASSEDPESLYYLGRQLAELGQIEHAGSVLFSVLEHGFVFGSAMALDPWFASLRQSPEGAEIQQLADRKRELVHAAFLEAGGNELLNLA